MRAIFGLVLIAGLGLAGFAVYMLQDYVSGLTTRLARPEQASKPPFKVAEIYVIDKAIDYGDVLTPEHVRKISVNGDALPEGTFPADFELFPDDNKEPRMVLRPMEKNEPLLASKITNPGEGAGLTSLLDPGMRAFAIEVDVASGVSGFLRPGDKVDIYWTGSVTMASTKNTEGMGGSRRDVTKLIESGVEIIAVDQQASGDVTGATIARTVTVSIRPQQVARLGQAQYNGKLSLSLVGLGDETVADNIEVDQNALLGLVAAPAPVIEEKEQVCTIRTRRGAEVIEIPIPCTN